MLRDVSGQSSQCVPHATRHYLRVQAHLDVSKLGKEGDGLRENYCIADSHGGDGALTSAIANRFSSFGLAYALQCVGLHNSKKPSGRNRSGRGCRRFS